MAVIATPNDLGAITALWKKPASYARFLGVELSLAYAQRLLVVMPNGFGFNWQGHSTAGAYRVLGKLPLAAAGSGLATAAETAVRALASASGVRSGPPAAGSRAAGTAGGVAAHRSAAGNAGIRQPTPQSARPRHPASRCRSSWPSWPALWPLVALGGWLARRAGFGPCRGSRLVADQAPAARMADGAPRLAIPGTWLAGGFVGRGDRGCSWRTRWLSRRARGTPGRHDGGRVRSPANPNLDPGTALSGIAPGFTLTDQFGQPVR